MTAPVSALADEKMTIRDLAQRWAAELSVDWRMLENKLLTEAIEGKFDELPSGRGLLVCDHKTGRHWSTTGLLLRGQLQESGNFAKNCRFLLEMEGLGLHRDAVGNFAERRGLSAPSWWPVEKSDSAIRRNRRGVGAPRTLGEEVEAAMQRIPRDRLVAMKEKEMEHEFGASRATCRAGRNRVLGS